MEALTLGMGGELQSVMVNSAGSIGQCSLRNRRKGDKDCDHGNRAGCRNYIAAERKIESAYYNNIWRRRNDLGCD